MRDHAQAGGALAFLASLLLSSVSTGADLEWQPKVGFEFEHFGETYRLTEDRDTVSTISDFGTLVGVTARTAPGSANRFRLDADFHYGRETRRIRLDGEGRLRRGAHAFELSHQGSYRFFRESGDYSVSSNYLDDYARLAYEFHANDALRMRFHETLAVAWFEKPNEYNLNTLLHRPGCDLRLRFGDLNEARIGYRFGRRTVPDSTSLEYRRHTGELDLNLLFGWTSSLDLSHRLERRVYPPGSVRESSWENRFDLSAATSPSEKNTLRLVHQNEFLRYEQPDELDFDYHWVRTGFTVEIHQTENLDFSATPLYTFLTSDVAPEEEYAEFGLELGLHWRLGRGTWLTISDEVGSRDYESPVLATEETEADGATSSTSRDDEGASEESLFSDYVYNRVTVLLSAEVAAGVFLDLFANWEPENHSLDQHDSDSRLVSAEVEYRF